MDEEKKKEGLSVKDLEKYAKKHRFEIFFCLLFVLACLFSFALWGATFGLFCLGIGAIISIFFSEKVTHFSEKMASSLFAKGGTTVMIVGIVALVVAIFLPPLIFLIAGGHAGKSMLHTALNAASNNQQPPTV